MRSFLCITRLPRGGKTIIRTCSGGGRSSSISQDVKEIASNDHGHLSYAEILQRRRAIRSFDPNRAIEPALLKQVLIESQTAPSSFNLQPYKVPQCAIIHTIVTYRH